MIRSMMFVGAMSCAMVASSVASAANVDLSLNLDFNTPGDLSSGGTWTAVATADERGLAGISFLVSDSNNDAAPTIENPFVVFETLQVSSVVEAVTGFGGSFLPEDIGVIGGSFPSSYTDPTGIAALAGQPDLGSFTGGVPLVSGSFSPGVVPLLLASFGTLGAGANVLDTATGRAVAATLNLTVRTVIPEPAAIALFSHGLIGLAVVRRR